MKRGGSCERLSAGSSSAKSPHAQQLRASQPSLDDKRHHIPLDLSIPETVVVYPRVPESEFVVFRIDVRAGREQFISDHRYSDFRIFHKAMRSTRCTAGQSCTFCQVKLPWRLMSFSANHSIPCIEERRQGLEAYLQAMQGRKLCHRHSVILNRFLDASLDVVLGDCGGSSLSSGSRARLAFSKSHWAVPVAGAFASWGKTSLQFFDSCRCHVRATETGQQLDITRYGSLLDGGASVSRARVRAVGDMFAACFTPAQFPSTTHIERWLREYRAPAVPRSERNRFRDTRSGLRTSPHHPLYWLLLGSDTPACFLRLMEQVWDMADADSVPISDELLMFPAVCKLLRGRYREICDGATVSKRLAQEMCREVMACYGAGRCAECAKSSDSYSSDTLDFTSREVKPCCFRAGSMQVASVSVMIHPPPPTTAAFPATVSDTESCGLSSDTICSSRSSSAPPEMCLSVESYSPMVLVGGMSIAEASLEEVEACLSGPVSSRSVSPTTSPRSLRRAHRR